MVCVILKAAWLYLHYQSFSSLYTNLSCSSLLIVWSWQWSQEAIDRCQHGCIHSWVV